MVSCLEVVQGVFQLSFFVKLEHIPLGDELADSHRTHKGGPIPKGDSSKG